VAAGDFEAYERPLGENALNISRMIASFGGIRIMVYGHVSHVFR
jgi:hypothetical protein